MKGIVFSLFVFGVDRGGHRWGRAGLVRRAADRFGPEASTEVRAGRLGGAEGWSIANGMQSPRCVLQLLKTVFFVNPLLVLKGHHHYWKYDCFFLGP